MLEKLYVNITHSQLLSFTVTKALSLKRREKKEKKKTKKEIKSKGLCFFSPEDFSPAPKTYTKIRNFRSNLFIYLFIYLFICLFIYFIHEWLKAIVRYILVIITHN